MKKIIFLFLLIPTFLTADTLELTEQMAVEAGLKNSVSLKIEELRLLNQKRTIDSSYNILYPQINMTAGLSRSNNPASISSLVPDITSMTTPGVFDRVTLMEADISPYTLLAGIKVDFAFSMAMFDGIEQIKLNCQEGILTKQEAEKKLIRNIKKSFYQILLVEENLKLLEELAATLGKRYEQTLSDYNNGYVPELTLLNVQVAYKNMIPTIQNLRNNYENSLTLFKLSLGIDINTPVELIGKIEIPRINLDEIKEKISLENRFDLKNVDNKRAQLMTGIDAKRHTAYYPTVVLSSAFNPVLLDPFNGETWESGFFENWSDQGSVSLVVSIPIDGFLPDSRASNEIKEMKTQLEILKLQKTLLYENAAAEVDMLIKSLGNSLSNLEVLDLNIQAAEKNLKLTEEAYESGIKDFVALQGAEDNLQEARQNVLKEKANFLIILFDLEYALNTELVNNNNQEK